MSLLTASQLAQTPLRWMRAIRPRAPPRLMVLVQPDLAATEAAQHDLELSRQVRAATQPTPHALWA